MENARDELVRHIEDREVKHIHVEFREFDDVKILASGDLESVLPKIDIEYHSGYGSQELHGHIWYADGTWSDRDEYDGSEWWEYRTCPEIPISEEK